MFLTILLCYSQIFRDRVDSPFSFALDQSSDPKEDTLEKISDDSFVLMEKLCDQTLAKIHDESLEDEEDLLDGVDIPKFNDTLEEVEFILEMGEKLKGQKVKLNCTEASVTDNISSICMSDRHNATSGSQPPLKRLKLSVGPILSSTPNIGKPITSKMLSFVTPKPEFSSCRSMINQVSLLS